MKIIIDFGWHKSTFYVCERGRIVCIDESPEELARVEESDIADLEDTLRVTLLHAADLVAEHQQSVTA